MVDGRADLFRAVVGKVQPKNRGILPRLPKQLADALVALVPKPVRVAVKYARQPRVNARRAFAVVLHHRDGLVKEAVAADMLQTEAQRGEAVCDLVEQQQIVVGDAVPVDAGVEA